MFSHIMIGSNDIARSKKFYDALFAAMGAQPGTEDARGRLAYSHNGGRFMVSKPNDGKPASQANGGARRTPGAGWFTATMAGFSWCPSRLTASRLAKLTAAQLASR